MPPVFHRQMPNPHPYDAALGTWLVSGRVGYQAMARNLMHDHRVSQEREASFDTSCKQPRAAADLEQALGDYHKAKVRHRTLPEYVYTLFNRMNLVAAGPATPRLLAKTLKLVRLLDLNGLAEVYEHMKCRHPSHPIFASFPGRHGGKETAYWLDERLEGKSDDEKRSFSAEVFSALRSYRKTEKPFQPVWVTTWGAIQKFLTEPAERWLELLGMYRPTAGRWLLVLCYTVGEAGTVARPTQLDSGWYAFHFPSPAHVPLETGGHSMDLRPAPPANLLLPEFIHKEITHKISHYVKLERTANPTSGDLQAQRQKHLELLVREYGNVVLAWMPNCV
jgi:hypothetical protein